MKIRHLARHIGITLHEAVVNYLMIHWYFRRPGTVISNDVLEAASQAGIDPLEIIRSGNYLDNPKHYERSI